MLNVGFLSLDILIILILFLVLFLLSFKYGKKLIHSLIISIYPTVLIFDSSSLEKINLSEQTSQAIVFLIGYIFIVFVIWKNIHVKKYHSNFRKVLDYFLLITSYLILFVSVYITSATFLSSLYNFSGTITDLVSKIPIGLSLIIPILIILLTSRKDLE